MLPYVLLEIILVVLFLVEQSREKYGTAAFGKYKWNMQRNVFLGWLAIGITGLFMGLRGSFTQDYSNYCDIFLDTIQKSFWQIATELTYQEKGYLFLNKAVGFFTSNPNVFLFIEAFIFVGLTIFVGMKMTDHVMLFVLLFVNAGIYFHSFNMVRQALAAAVVFSAIEALVEKKTIKFVILVLLAVNIHTTAIAALVLWPLLVQEVNVRNIVRTVVITIVADVSLGTIIAFVQKFRYSGYTYGMEGGSINAFVFQAAICTFSWIVCGRGLIDVKERKYRILLNSSLLYCMFSVLMLSVSQLSRIMYFFSTPMLVLGGDAMYKVYGKSRVIVQTGIIALLVLYMYVWLSGTGYEPYWTFLQA